MQEKEKLIILFILVSIGALFSLSSFLILIFKKNKKEADDSLNKEVKELKEGIEKLNNINLIVQENLKIYFESVLKDTEKLKKYSEDNIINFQKENENTFNKLKNELLSTIQRETTSFKEINENKSKFLIDKLDTNLNNIKEQNKNLEESVKEKLKAIEKTVDEKIEQNISKSIQNAFDIISKQLKTLESSLASINDLSNNIKDFDSVLKGIKTRGTLGEVLFKDLLDDILGPSLYEEQFMLQSNSKEKVDFAIKIPNDEGRVFYFPIDSKFPMSDYERLLLAKKEGNNEHIEEQTKKLSSTIIEQAKKIKKYIIPDKTTNFAAMYLPSEGLYSEVISIDGLLEKVRKEGNILILGPSVSAAWISVLKVGFQTVNIKKKSQEIISAFSLFQKEFTNIIKEIQSAKITSEKIGTTLDSVIKKTTKINDKIVKIGSIEEQNQIED